MNSDSPAGGAPNHEHGDKPMTGNAKIVALALIREIRVLQTDGAVTAAGERLDVLEKLLATGSVQ
jgi:hypothetical protein